MMRHLVPYICILGIIATVAVSQVSAPRPCDQACRNWYAGGADLMLNNPFARLRK